VQVPRSQDTRTSQARPTPPRESRRRRHPTSVGSEMLWMFSTRAVPPLRPVRRCSTNRLTDCRTPSRRKHWYEPACRFSCRIFRSSSIVPPASAAGYVRGTWEKSSRGSRACGRPRLMARSAPCSLSHDADDLDVVRRARFEDFSESPSGGTALGDMKETASICLNPR